MSNYQQYTVVELRELAMDRKMPEVMHSRYIKKGILIELLEKYDREHRSTTNQEVMISQASSSNSADDQETLPDISNETLTNIHNDICPDMVITFDPNIPERVQHLIKILLLRYQVYRIRVLNYHGFQLQNRWAVKKSIYMKRPFYRVDYTTYNNIKHTFIRVDSETLDVYQPSGTVPRGNLIKRDYPVCKYSSDKVLNLWRKLGIYP